MKKLILLLAVLAVFGACQHDADTGREQLHSEILALEKKLLEKGDASLDRQAALSLIEKTKLYAKNYPQDTLTPELLFKAADVARGAREFGKAIHLWGLVWRNYGSHPKASLALFLQGFTFDTDLKDSKTASKYYMDFLERYPSDPLADQVEQLLAVVEVSPEELVKKFEAEAEAEEVGN